MTGQRGPGRPRDEELDVRLISAVLELIDSEQEVTVSRVVSVSGVSRAGLYRRWPALTDLIAAALDRGRVVPTEIPDGADLREAVFGAMVGDPALAAGGAGASLAAIEARFRQRIRLVMADRELQRTYWDSHVRLRRAPVERALAAAVARGELRADLDPEAAFDAFAGVAYYQLVVRGDSLAEPATQDRARAALDLLWRGMQPEGEAARTARAG